MAYDKVVDSAALDATLGGIADAIREKTGGTEKLTIDQMAAAIGGIQVGGGGDDPYPNIETITIAATFNTADAARSVFSPMAESGKMTIFVRKTARIENNTLMAVYLGITSGLDSYTRWKNGQGANSANVWAASYDTVANAGDEYYKVVLG